MLESRIKNLKIENFRNFYSKEFVFESNKILISGPNGSGKTSVLEAISLMSAGKGIKGSKFSEQITFESQEWFLKFHLESYIGNVIIEQNHSDARSKRNLFLNSRTITATELNKLTTIFWPTPQLNGLFQESQSIRRKYYDRIVYAFFHEHASNIHKYEHYQTERLKILMMDYYDKNWVDVIENKLTELAIKISNSRIAVKNLVQNSIDNMDGMFPKITIFLEGDLEKIIEQDVNPTEKIKEKYKNSRIEDTRAHRNHFGALKTDFFVHHNTKNIIAKSCSTGEQQACMITLLLGQTRAFLDNERKKPILLLDELFVHLDYNNRVYLTEYISEQQIQTIVTTTESHLCSEFASNAYIIEL